MTQRNSPERKAMLAERRRRQLARKPTTLPIHYRLIPPNSCDKAAAKSELQTTAVSGVPADAVITTRDQVVLVTA